MPDEALPETFGVPPFAAVELLDDLLEGVVIHAADGRVVYCNPAAQRLLRIGRDQLMASRPTASQWNLLDVFGRRLEDSEFPACRILEGEDRISGMVIALEAEDSGPPTWLLLSGFARSVGTQRYAVVSFVDTRTPLGFSFRDLVEMSEDAVLVTDARLENGGPFIVYANPAFEALCGYPIEALLGRSPTLLQGEGTSAASRAEIRAALTAGRAIRREMLNYHRDGHAYWIEIQIAPVRDANGDLTHFVAIQRDVSAMHDATERLLHEATHDPLTGLLNRRGFAERAELLMAQAQRLGAPVAVLMLDIDHFKEVNDRVGHEAGDRLLCAFAQMLQQRLRASDLVARLGGDEFVVLLTLGGCADSDIEKDAECLAEALREGAKAAFAAQGAPDCAALSIGLAPVGDDAPLAVLLSRADQALYAAKQGGRNRVHRN